MFDKAGGFLKKVGQFFLGAFKSGTVPTSRTKRRCAGMTRCFL